MKNKVTLDDVSLIVNNEGLGYAIESYLHANEIEDKNLKKLWKKAEKILAEIREMLAVYGEDE